MRESDMEISTDQEYQGFQREQTYPAYASVAAPSRKPETTEGLLEANHAAAAFDRPTWEILVALARTVDASSPWTANHSKRVTALATSIGRTMGLALEKLGTLCCAALLHDIGKVGVATNILDKPSKLTSNEVECMEEHPAKGARILEPLSTCAPVVPIVLQHHERLDGTGYPCGLRGDAICPGARILAVADVYDALVSERPYRSSWNSQKAIEFIKKGTHTFFDSQVIEAFLDVMARKDREREEDMSEVLLDITPSSRSFCLLGSRKASESTEP